MKALCVCFLFGERQAPQFAEQIHRIQPTIIILGNYAYYPENVDLYSFIGLSGSYLTLMLSHGLGTSHRLLEFSKLILVPAQLGTRSGVREYIMINTLLVKDIPPFRLFEWPEQ